MIIVYLTKENKLRFRTESCTENCSHCDIRYNKATQEYSSYCDTKLTKEDVTTWFLCRDDIYKHRDDTKNIVWSIPMNG